MATQKPFSTITYNTQSFLKQTLNTLVNMGMLTYYEFIEHSPDTDDTKKHFHLYMIPAKSINLATFKNYFLEHDPTNDKPLCPTVFKSSNYGDWYWYALHDIDYLKSKQLERNIHYHDTDIYSYDRNFHFQLVTENPLIDFCKMSDMKIRQYICDCVYNGVSLQEILTSGYIPLGKTQSSILLYNALCACIDNTEKKDCIKIKSPKELKEIKVDRFINRALNSPIDEELPFSSQKQIEIDDIDELYD